jgi:maltooligosyltrehalose trehalohydrolase
VIARGSGHGHARKLFGAVPSRQGTTFRVWASAARSAAVLIEGPGEPRSWPLAPEGEGLFAGTVHDAGPGTLYRYSINGGEPMPDPASRFQPFGVHGPSEVIDAAAYAWGDAAWRGIDPSRAVFYELHVGTFTRAGTFDRAIERIAYLRDLGVTIIELMPVADFPGERNWGYDGVCLFAPSRAYGRPEDLRRFVDVAHQAGLGVMLDVVYNHLGPDGAYLYAFAPEYFSSRHESAWGQSVNLDGPHSQIVREFILDNVRHWLTEYHLDGLRLDATHALADESSPHIVAEIARTVHDVTDGRAMVVAEDHRNDAHMLRERPDGGWGLDGVWADDFHHIVRRILAGDHEGYYADYRASVHDLAATIEHGWFFTGQYSEHLGHPRGTDPSGIPLRKFVICLQNHDQVGNRAFGDRLNDNIDLAAFRAASTLLLFAPQTPLLFMGQEWAASTPFRYFTDHGEELGQQVVSGRRREFERFSAFRDPAVRDLIPSPQATETFESSRLDWTQRAREPHQRVWQLYRRCLDLRARWLARADARRARDDVRAEACGEDTLVLRYSGANAQLVVVSRLRGSGTVRVAGLPAHAPVILTSEDPPFSNESQVPHINGDEVTFAVPSSIVFAYTR